MRPQDVTGTISLVADGARGVVDLVSQSHTAALDQTYRWTARGLGERTVAPVRRAHRALTTATYASVRAGIAAGRISGRAAGRVAAAWGDRRAGGIPGQGSPATDHAAVAQVMAVVQGMYGDRLDADPDAALAYRMSVRANGQDVPTTAAGLLRAYPDATGRLAVFVHGLMETELAWSYKSSTFHGEPTVTLGARLREALGYTPVFIRYNTGLAIADNGQRLHDLLDEVVAGWPVPVDSIVLIGHSMGGLVAHHAVDDGVPGDWAAKVAHTVTIGSPRQGAGLARFSRRTAQVTAKMPTLAWLTGLIESRSLGIRDLALGRAEVPDGSQAEGHTELEVTMVPVGRSRRRLAVAGMLLLHPGHPAARLLGDGLVSVASAHALAEPTDDLCVVAGAGHLDLLNHPSVHEQVIAFLSEDAGVPSR